MIKYRVSNDREHIIALVDCRSFQLFSVCYVFFLLSDKNVWNSLIANDSLQAINKMALLNKLNVHVCCSSVCFFNFISSVFVSILVFQFCKCLVWTWNAFHFKSFIKCLFFNECEKYRCLFIISYVTQFWWTFVSLLYQSWRCWLFDWTTELSFEHYQPKLWNEFIENFIGVSSYSCKTI